MKGTPEKSSPSASSRRPQGSSRGTERWYGRLLRPLGRLTGRLRPKTYPSTNGLDHLDAAAVQEPPSVNNREQKKATAPPVPIEEEAIGTQAGEDWRVKLKDMVRQIPESELYGSLVGLLRRIEPVVIDTLDLSNPKVEAIANKFVDISKHLGDSEETDIGDYSDLLLTTDRLGSLMNADAGVKHDSEMVRLLVGRLVKKAARERGRAQFEKRLEISPSSERIAETHLFGRVNGALVEIRSISPQETQSELLSRPFRFLERRGEYLAGRNCQSWRESSTAIELSPKDLHWLSGKQSISLDELDFSSSGRHNSTKKILMGVLIPQGKMSDLLSEDLEISGRQMEEGITQQGPHPVEELFFNRLLMKISNVSAQRLETARVGNGWQVFYASNNKPGDRVYYAVDGEIDGRMVIVVVGACKKNKQTDLLRRIAEREKN